MTEPMKSTEQRDEVATLPLDSTEPARPDPEPAQRTPDNPERPKKAVRKDAVIAWRQEARTAAVEQLLEVRLDTSLRLLVPFTHLVDEVDVHYLDYGNMRGYYRCGGPGCTLCRIGRSVEKRDLLPVYDPIARKVMVLPVSPNMRPGALKPQLVPILAKLKSNQRVLISVSKPDRATYRVMSNPLPDNADDGADAILEFLGMYDGGAIELCSVYPLLSEGQLVEVPEVATSLRALGLAK
jgi:hypothetical protein